jgi:hypothetical protein
MYWSLNSAVGIAVGYGLDNGGGQSSSPDGGENFIFFMSSRPFLGPTPPPSSVGTGDKGAQA